MIEPWMVRAVAKRINEKGEFWDDYQGLDVDTVLTRWLTELEVAE